MAPRKQMRPKPECVDSPVGDGKHASCYHPEMGYCGDLHVTWFGVKGCLKKFRTKTSKTSSDPGFIVLRVTEDGGKHWRPLLADEWFFLGKAFGLIHPAAKL